MNKEKHLEFIQNTITRMNTNSFQIKGWVITLVSALLAIYASTKNSCFILVGIAPALLFWFLDTYYLRLERRFRGLYDDVAEVAESPREIKELSMNIKLYKTGKYSFVSVLKSTAPLYLSVIVGLVALYYL